MCGAMIFTPRINGSPHLWIDGQVLHRQVPVRLEEPHRLDPASLPISVSLSLPSLLFLFNPPV